MLKTFLRLTFASIVLGLAAVANAQVDSQQSAVTQYEKFLKRTDVVIVTQTYSLPNLPGGGGFKISAKVAWALGQPNKVYAADIGGRIIDFNQLVSIQSGLDRMIRAVNSSFDSLKASSMSYASPSGVS